MHAYPPDERIWYNLTLFTCACERACIALAIRLSETTRPCLHNPVLSMYALPSWLTCLIPPLGSLSNYWIGREKSCGDGAGRTAQGFPDAGVVHHPKREGGHPEAGSTAAQRGIARIRVSYCSSTRRDGFSSAKCGYKGILVWLRFLTKWEVSPLRAKREWRFSQMLLRFDRKMWIESYAKSSV